MIGANPRTRPVARILVIRNDKLGDFMLAWPALAMLRAGLPSARIAVLVPAYTAPLAAVCPSINEVILDPREPGDWRNGRALARLLRNKEFDAVISLFSRFDTGLCVWSAGIPYRLAPATKLAQVFYNHRVKQRRSASVKPEYEYNLDLVQIFLCAHGMRETPMPLPPYLHFDDAAVRTLEQQFRRAHGVPASHRLLFLHAGHGGSANNLSLEQYAELARYLGAGEERYLVLTAGPGERERVESLAARLTGVQHCVYAPQTGLVEFAQHLQFCDLFVSGSTGPLHLAAALNCRTAAFYPNRRSSTALRWQTMNGAERRLAFQPPAGAAEDDMGAINVRQAAETITASFLAGRRLDAAPTVKDPGPQDATHQ